MSKGLKIFLGMSGIFLAMVILVQLASIIGLSASGDTLEISFKANKVYLLELKGPIFLSRPTMKKLEKIRKNPQIKAVVLRFESPGGTVAAAQEIYSKVLELRKEGKIVVSSMGNLAASGAYYISSACDEIVANPGTLTGSIGVIMSSVNFSKVADKLGIQLQVIKSGKYKDIFSSFREMSPGERSILQKTIDDTYDQFIQAILNVRAKRIAEKFLKRPYEEKKDFTKVRGFLVGKADGRIFTGRQAMKIGLVDTLGGLKDSISIAGKLAGIKGKPIVVEEKKKNVFWTRLADSLTKVPAAIMEMHPGFYYMMK